MTKSFLQPIFDRLELDVLIVDSAITSDKYKAAVAEAIGMLIYLPLRRLFFTTAKSTYLAQPGWSSIAAGYRFHEIWNRVISDEIAAIYPAPVNLIKIPQRCEFRPLHFRIVDGKYISVICSYGGEEPTPIVHIRPKSLVTSFSGCQILTDRLDTWITRYIACGHARKTIDMTDVDAVKLFFGYREPEHIWRRNPQCLGDWGSTWDAAQSEAATIIADQVAKLLDLKEAPPRTGGTISM